MMNSNNFSQSLSLMTIPQVKGEKFGFDGSRELEPCSDHVDVYLMTSAPR